MCLVYKSNSSNDLAICIACSALFADYIDALLVCNQHLESGIEPK